MPINSRAKGCRGERLWRDELRAAGFTARRGQQFAGGTDSPDVVCEALKGLHMEVKCVQALNLDKACEQAERDAGRKAWIVAHKKDRKHWKVTMSADTFFQLLREGMDAFSADSKCIAEYAQISKKRININPLIEEVRQSLATPAPLVSGEQGLGDPGR